MGKINCWSHFLNPLHYTHKGKKHPIRSKLSLTVYSLAIGVFTLGIGGVLFFYISTARQKIRRLTKIKGQNQPKTTQLFSNTLTHTTTKSASSLTEFLDQFTLFNHSRSSLNLSLSQCKKEFSSLDKLASVKQIQESQPSLELANGESGQDRYSNNYSWKHSRVVLSNTSFLQNDYVNASWIDKKTIAAQGPTLQTTISFLHMVYENDVGGIVMLTSETAPRGFRYWPNKKNKELVNYLPYRLMLLKEHSITLASGYHLIQRKLQISIDNEPPKIVYHFQIPDWPDFGVIDDPSALRQALEIIHNKTNDEPLVYHCSAGLGRTGTLLAIERLLEDNSDPLNVAKTIASMRLQRPQLVQTPEQYKLIFDTLALPSVKKLPKDKIPKANICINPKKAVLKEFQASPMNGLLDSDGVEIDSSEPLLAVTCYYPNKKFVKEIDVRKLHLPIRVFEKLAENHSLRLTYQQKDFELILSQNHNPFDFDSRNFEDFTSDLKAKYIASTKNPLLGYRLTPSSRLFHLVDTPGGLALKEPKIKHLKQLESPQITPCNIVEKDNRVLISFQFPYVEVSDIDILVNEDQVIFYAKLSETTVQVSDQDGGSINLNLENEYFSSFFWKAYANISQEELIEKLADAKFKFKNDMLKIKIPC